MCTFEPAAFQHPLPNASSRKHASHAKTLCVCVSLTGKLNSFLMIKEKNPKMHEKLISQKKKKLSRGNSKSVLL